MQFPPHVSHSKSEPKACAMILAAGRGERMRPLTDQIPKPLLAVRGKPLMQWPMEALVRAGFEHIMINTAWLGERIQGHYGSFLTLPGAGVAYLRYSNEAQDFGYALETAGGIARALPHLAEVFWVVAGDVFVPEFEFKPQALAQLTASDLLAHIWLVPNPLHNPLGDFGLSDQGLALNLTPNSSASTPALYTFSTIALYRRAFFERPYCDIVPGNPQARAAPLAPLLRAAMDRGQVGATLYTGPWTDVGTPERLAQLNAV